MLFDRTPRQALPSMFGKYKQTTSGKKGKHPISTYDRDIVCLPYSYPGPNGRYAIPRKDTRANLATQGLIGKIRLSSTMEEDEILSEVRSAFSAAMGHDPHFPFTFLQRCGPGTNALAEPSTSSFVWTAREVIRMAGQGCIYIRADRELIQMRKYEVEVSI